MSLLNNLYTKKFKVFLGFIFFLVTLMFGRGVLAYSIVENTTITIHPQETKRIFISIKNNTNYNWFSGSGKTALYLYGNQSVFYHSNWLKQDLGKSIDQTTVKPGEVATVSFYVKAPKDIGNYTERFLLGNNSRWHKNTVVQINFKVINGVTQDNNVGKKYSNLSQARSCSVANVLANKTAYNSELVSFNAKNWMVKSGDVFSVEVKIKNTGKKIWKNFGDSRVALYSNNSLFKDSSWQGDYEVGSFAENAIYPGHVAVFKFWLKAPNQIRSFLETLELRVNKKESINGSGFLLPIAVQASSIVDSSQSSMVTDSDNTTNQTIDSYQAKILLKPAITPRVSGGSTLTFLYGIKNSGKIDWKNRGLKLKEIVPSLGNLTVIKDGSWYNSDTILKSNKTVKVGRLDLISFKLKAPLKKGSYNVKLFLTSNDVVIDGGEVDVPIVVTSDDYSVTQDNNNNNNTQSHVVVQDNSSLMNEPIIRVGLYKTNDDTLKVRGVSANYKLMQNGKEICSLNKNDILTVVFDRQYKVYKASANGCHTQSSQYYQVVAVDGTSPLEITDYSRPVSWLPGANDNKFRGKLELRFTPATDNVWMINELPISWYLKGIAETSELSPLEFQKTLLVAARTYAMYHVTRATKHKKEFFIVDAHYDQVYRGYGHEARSPSIARAVDETRGTIVTYNGKIAITPYFSRSDGRTRSWKEVWYGDVPWCQGVAVPQDNGKTLWGHGVGMSASGALMMAAHEDKKYDWILKYFYTGITLKKWYK